ncbi:Conserved oligomeric Golgi complex subunit 2 [Haplosporangium sp. Z 11]|nr:Conserved oligomeric Golgi complex subunit 2 [Haplosporangium sp. Z 11]
MTNDMLRKMYKGRPPPFPPHLDDLDNDNEDAEANDTFGSSTTFQSPAPAVHPSKLNRSGVYSASARYAPLDWKDYFESKRSVTVQGEGESEADITFNVFETREKPDAPLFVMHHGAGLCALTFALTAREIRKIAGEDASVLSYDVRGHGVAIETLANMHGWLERRPNAFRSLDKVVQWGVKSGTVRNVESARVSCPPLVVPSKESTSENPSYVWRTDLAASEQYWEEWFTGLTQKFLSSKAGRLLVLAGTDRLDKDMTIAQMQGKFQLLVFPNSGHAIQEDEPERMAKELIAFWKRNERLVLPPHPFLPHGAGTLRPQFLAHHSSSTFHPDQTRPDCRHRMVASSGAVDNIRRGIGAGQQQNSNVAGSTATEENTGTTSQSKKPSHLSIDSMGANSAFLHTLNSQLHIAARNSNNHNNNNTTTNSSNHSRGHQQDEPSQLENDFPLSVGIDRAALIAPDFDTDEFLSARRHLPLEELKSQLIAHMKELKTELIELINSDYADFINLSTNLNGVDRMMEDLRKPLDRMKDDAITVKSNLQSVIESLEQKLEHRAEIREKKASLQLLLNISESVAKVEGLLQISGTSETSVGQRESNESISVVKRLERVAIEYNQMQYLVSKGANLPFVSNIDWRLVRIKETMSENLATVLRTCINPTQPADTDPASNKESLTQCMRTYALIDQTADAEKVITDDLLAPFINKTITRAALSDPSYASNNSSGNNTRQTQPRPLVIMYNRLIAFIDSHCSTLISITQKDLKGTNFDIPVNCIWGITAQTILKNIPQILSPGIADDFHRNYTDTMSFVSKIEELCGSRRSLTRLRSQANYQAFMKRWQLPAYFQLRFRDISMSIEDALQMNVETGQKSQSAEAHLSASIAIIRAIERCWSPDVYIYGIAHSFWKFTLQLMARYSIWISTNLAKDLDQPKERTIQSRSSSPAPGSSGNSARQSGRSTPIPGNSLRTAGPVGKASLEDMMLQHLSMIVSDIDFVTTRLQEVFEQQIRPKLPPSMVDEPVLKESFDQNLQAIRQDVPAAQQRITALLTKHCVETLANVKNITSRYGEGPPKEPSHFVPLILAPLRKYRDGSGLLLKEESRQAWTMEVIVATTNKYSTVLAEKLLEWKMLEETTNKMKAAGAKSRAGGLLSRPNLPNVFSSMGSSDAEANMSTDDKQRLQCVLDVRRYKSELIEFNIDPDRFEPYKDLKANTQPYENLLSVTNQN